MPIIFQCTFSHSEYRYTHPDYTVFNLTNFDQTHECKILITNESFISKDKIKFESNSRKRKCGSLLDIEQSSNVSETGSATETMVEKDRLSTKNELIKILIPITNKDFIISKIPCFKDLLLNIETVEIDGEKVPVVHDQNPRVFARILRMLYTQKLTLTLDNCIDVYRIFDSLNLREDRNPKISEDQQSRYLVDDLQRYIEINFTKLPKHQFDKILEYNLQGRFWDHIFNVIRPDSKKEDDEKSVISSMNSSDRVVTCDEVTKDISEKGDDQKDKNPIGKDNFNTARDQIKRMRRKMRFEDGN